MNIVNVVEKDDVTLCVWVEVSEGRRALFNIHWPSFKNVHERKPFRGAEAGAAIVHNAFGSNVFCRNLIHTTTAQHNTQDRDVENVYNTSNP